MICLTVLVLLLPAMAFGQGLDHRAKQSMKDAHRLSEGQKRYGHEERSPRKNGYGAQEWAFRWFTAS